MAYGTIKVDTITFTDAGVDKSVTISGLVQNPTFTGNVTATGTISGNTVRGQTISGVTVTGTTANFTSGNFTNISGGTHTITSGVFASGTAASPSISFVSDPNTGIYSPGADQVAISTNGTGRLFVDASGNVGVGAAPDGQLSLLGANSNTPRLRIQHPSNDKDAAISTFFDGGGTYLLTGSNHYLSSTGSNTKFDATSGSSAWYLDGSGLGIFYNSSGSGSITERFRIRSDGTFEIKCGGTAGVSPAVSVNPSASANSLVIDSSGRLGLGTSSPSANLHISSGGNTEAIIGAPSGSPIITMLAAGAGAGILGYQNLLRLGTVTGAGGAGFLEFVRIDNSGRVGIGTTSPASTLDVNGDVTVADRIIHAGDTNTQIRFPAADTVSVETNGSERARIDSSGRLGLGTSSPSTLLTVQGDGTFRVSTGNVGVGLQTGSLNGSWYLNDADDSLRWYSSTGGDRLTIGSTGNVGIGTTSPGYRLSVVGDIITTTANGTAARLLLDQNGQRTYSIEIPASNNGLAIRDLVADTERARIDSSGRLLVGTSSASGNNYLQIQGDAGGATGTGGISLRRNVAPSGMGEGAFEGIIDFGPNDGGVGARIAAIADAQQGTNDYPSRLVFSTTADGASSPTERMRIGSNGYVQFSETGTYSPDATSGWHKFYQSANQRCIQTYSTSSTFTNYSLIQYIAAGGGTGSGFASGYSDNGSIQRYIIFSNGNIQNTNNSYAGISDLKLKENITDANSQWLDIKSLQVRNYNLKHSPDHRQIGVIAQEIEQISPGLVYETPDRDAEGNDLGTVTKSVNYSVLYMKAVKALQEAMKRIEQLETEMVAVKAQLS